jgi:hypothetical protein
MAKKRVLLAFLSQLILLSSCNPKADLALGSPWQVSLLIVGFIALCAALASFYIWR